MNSFDLEGHGADIVASDGEHLIVAAGKFDQSMKHSLFYFNVPQERLGERMEPKRRWDLDYKPSCIELFQNFVFVALAEQNNNVVMIRYDLDNGNVHEYKYNENNCSCIRLGQTADGDLDEVYGSIEDRIIVWQPDKKGHQHTALIATDKILNFRLINQPGDVFGFLYATPSGVYVKGNEAQECKISQSTLFDYAESQEVVLAIADEKKIIARRYGDLIDLADTNSNSRHTETDIPEPIKQIKAGAGIIAVVGSNRVYALDPSTGEFVRKPFIPAGANTEYSCMVVKNAEG